MWFLFWLNSQLLWNTSSIRQTVLVNIFYAKSIWLNLVMNLLFYGSHVRMIQTDVWFCILVIIHSIEIRWWVDAIKKLHGMMQSSLHSCKESRTSGIFKLNFITWFLQNFSAIILSHWSLVICPESLMNQWWFS